MKVFGQRLKELRIDKRLSQQKIADMFGVAQRTVFAWENNLQEPDMETIVKLSDYFGVSIDYLFGKEN